MCVLRARSFVPPDADEAAMEQYHAEMQTALDRITVFADAQFTAGKK